MHASRSAAAAPSRGAGGELDRQTLRRAQGGDPNARRTLVEHHARAVFGVLSRILSPAGHAAHVEDLAQESMVRVLGALTGFDPEGPARLSTWILTIATRVALKHLARKRIVLVPPPAEATLPHDGASPEAVLAARQQQQRARAALAAMSPQLRSTFVLADAHDVPLVELAALIDVPVATVRTRLHRARAQIRRALDEELDHG